MELQDAVEQRRSIRKFKDQIVEAQVLEQLVDAAAFAPSWKNSQVVRYYAVVDREKRQQIVESMRSFNQAACASAAVLMICSMVRNRSGYERDGSFSTPKGKGWQFYDAGCSNMAFCLKAHALGLGTVIMGYCEEAIVANIIGLPETEEIGAVIALGYPDEQPACPKRKLSDQILKIV